MIKISLIVYRAITKRVFTVSSRIVKSDHYFTIKHSAEILDKKTLELGYAQLTDMLLNHGKVEYKVGICDFSSIKTLAASKDDTKMIADALMYIFQSNPDFHFITVASDRKVKEAVNNMHEQLRGECELENLYLVSDTPLALKLIEQFDLS
ncbi:MAG: hypothetical protein KZQ64_15920 [gamma proteobacterium symbiont of Bathyaustriella thionipta]|nr:hypothetical protein [gamma proteobacterium symbiont of Bathyaustriella thionipta]MCU7950492.1 hypothetical protein [gamma proteobacterium symbiont of Bathyaustriella thionipta]MCU7954856.1 hypothetical protein [gamma proteobacterium symbiont of Bathyaustriella thionipta]MCU7958132.1 hypothetical protein [gamma proteobacterium symbiont of Bathyaustriella thionipta]MCU7967925.1 hypothetical protein [gamma proteobacterium symbiont of Bathyaustriella thionipta]